MPRPTHPSRLQRISRSSSDLSVSCGEVRPEVTGESRVQYAYCSACRSSPSSLSASSPPTPCWRVRLTRRRWPNWPRNAAFPLSPLPIATAFTAQSCSRTPARRRASSRSSGPFLVLRGIAKGSRSITCHSTRRTSRATTISVISSAAPIWNVRSSSNPMSA